MLFKPHRISSNDAGGQTPLRPVHNLRPELINAVRSKFENVVLDTLKHDLIYRISITSGDVPMYLRPD